MSIRTALGLSAVLAAIAIPSLSHAQRRDAFQPSGRYAGSGPFRPSQIERYRGSRQPLRAGGVTVYGLNRRRPPLRAGGATIYFPSRRFNGGSPIFVYPYGGYPYGYVPYATPYPYGYGYYYR